MRLLLLCISCCVLGSSCVSPQVITRLEPADDAHRLRWFYGNAYQQQTQDSLTVELAFFDASPDHLIFDVEIQNASGRSILFTPEVIELHNPNGKVVSALNPERERLALDVNQSKTNARARSWSISSIVTIGVVSVTPTTGTDNEGEVPLDRSFWMEEVLRRSTVRPGERIYGRVVAPRVDEWSALTVVVPIESLRYHFAFKQLATQPREFVD